MFDQVPAAVGVQVSSPVAVLKTAVDGLPVMDQLSVSPSGSLAAGAKRYALPMVDQRKLELTDLVLIASAVRPEEWADPDCGYAVWGASSEEGRDVLYREFVTRQLARLHGATHLLSEAGIKMGVALTPGHGQAPDGASAADGG